MIDFGTVKDMKADHGRPFSAYVSTRWYRAPECVLRSGSYGPPSDIFAAGAIMAELYNLMPIFPGADEKDQMNAIFKIIGTPDEKYWKEGYRLASKLKYEF